MPLNFSNKNKGGLDLGGVGKVKLRMSSGKMPSSGLSFSSDTKRQERRSRKTGSTPGGFMIQSKPDKGSRKTKLLVLFGVVLAFALAIAVGVVVYQQVVKNSMQPTVDESSLASALVAPEEDAQTYWMLYVETDSTSGAKDRGSVTDVALVYVDIDNDSMSFLWMPSDVRAYIAGYGYKTLNEAFELGHESMICAAASTLSGTDIAHYIEVNQAGRQAYLESLGKLGVDINEASRSKIAKAVASKIFGMSSEQLASQAKTIVGYAATDMDADALTSMLQSLQGMDVSDDFFQATMPTETDENGAVNVNTDSWSTMLERTESGRSPKATKKELKNYKSMRSANSIDIWNGVGVSGIASDCASHLKKLGWNVQSVGNAASFVYEETLVVYKYDDDEELADLVVSDLGQGRAVRSAARYNFDGDILVVVGEDYQPY